MAQLHEIQPEPISPSVITLTERLVEMVQDHEVAALGVAIVTPDGGVQALWSETHKVDG